MKKYLLIIIVFIISHNSFAKDKVSNLVMQVTYFIYDVKQLTLLKNNLSRHRQASIVGISGIGKTQLVRMYGYTSKDNYDLIWFIDCNLDINEEFLKLAQTINEAAKTSIISENVALVKKQIIDYLTYKDRWLLVFDNLKINDNKKIKDFIDWKHNGNIIFCSRSSKMLPNVIKMTAFSQDDAITLASNILEDDNKQSAEFLAKESAGYPMLIVQGAQLFNKVHNLDKEEYKIQIRRSKNKINFNMLLTINELKPSARKLLAKIALINNQSFSKELLSFISDDKKTLDDDLYQLFKFMLITNINTNEGYQVFEMHDIITQAILEINANNNKKCLEEIIIKLSKTMTKNDAASVYTLCTLPTVSENLEIILRNAEKYGLNVNFILDLRNLLLATYLNTYSRYQAEKMIDWFMNKEFFFRVWFMNDDQKHIYAGYLGLIGFYHEKDLSDFRTAITFFTKALKILNKLHGYTSLKYNYISHIAICQAWLGNVNLAQDAINEMEILSKQEIHKSEVDFAQHYIRSLLFFLNGRYVEALEQINKDVEGITKYVQSNDLVLTVTYLLRSEILNYMEKYKDAYVQAEQVYGIHKLHRKEDYRVLARIFTQMAKAELGLGKVDKALDHIDGAVAIFLAHERVNPKGANRIDDPDLANSYIVLGDIFFTLDKFQESIRSYRAAQDIYLHLYKDNSKNVAHVSYLYLQGAKAACKRRDLYYYQYFGEPQFREFGVQHRNTIKMVEYCKSCDIDYGLLITFPKYRRSSRNKHGI